VNTLAVTTYAIADLAEYIKNPRRGRVELISESLETTGQYRPIVVNAGTKTGRPLEVLAGNHTLKGAAALGWATIDAVTVDVDDEAAAKIVLADNATADRGNYDKAALSELLDEFTDFTGTGYDEADRDRLAEAFAVPDEDDWAAAFMDGLPPENRKAFTRTFNLTEDEADELDAALNLTGEDDAAAITTICQGAA
jgi:hypothetical protein